MEIRATFDTATVEGQMKVFNAQNGASISLKNVADGTVIDCVGVLQYEQKIDSYGAEQDSVITTLFAEDGSAYAGVSETVAKAGEKLIDFLRVTGLEKVKIRIVKAKSSRNQEFINLQIAG